MTESIETPPAETHNKISPRFIILITIAICFVSGFILYQHFAARAVGGLSIEIRAGYNLVVDSNVTSPSTYGPEVATVAGKFCNTNPLGGSTVTNVVGYIGDYASNTPGIYPSRSSNDGGFQSEHPELDTPDIDYSFVHLGSSADAIRYIGSLDPGECSVQYWHFTYPHCEANESPPCSQDPVWGEPTDPNDDLWLQFDIWGSGDSGAADNVSWAMHMRNEISAMANKIEPNPDGRWYNIDSSNVVRPGDVITSVGVNYTFGNVNKGFDNDEDGLYDYNAWMQPFGNTNYDPSCFRLIRTTGTLTVTRGGGNPPMIVNFLDQLYFTDLPADNTSVVGEVYYTFMALNGICVADLTPYQEAASGADNEKFNSDYGVGAPPFQSTTPEVSIDKSGPVTTTESASITYLIPFQNDGDEDVGMTLNNGYAVMPFTVEDFVPEDLAYVCGSASASLDYTPVTPPGYTVVYSKDSGLTWSDNETALWPECATPGTPTTQLSTSPDQSIVIHWRLSDPFPKKSGDPNNSKGTTTFQAWVPGNYISGGGSPFIENTACAKLDNADSYLDCATTITLIEGTASITGVVWQDEDSNAIKAGVATEPGIYGADGVTVYLYWDKNGDGLLDSGDVEIMTTNTTGTGDPNYSFTNLPAGDYLVVVETLDSDIPTGYRPTTPKVIAVTGLAVGATDSENDFGFGPTLQVIKDLVSTNTNGQGGLATFTIDLTNQRPGDGTADPFCRYKVWATIDHPTTGVTPPGGGPANSQWQNTSSALYSPDGVFAYTQMNNNTDYLGLSGFNTGQQIGSITSVEFLLHVNEIVNFKDTDTAFVRVYYNDTQIGSDYSYPGNTYFTGPASTDYLISQDITSLRTWTWSDFANNLTEMQVEGNPGGGAGNAGDLGLDAAAYVITTDQKCGSDDDIILTLPMTDTYDADLMTFVTAVPPEDNAYTSGSPNSTIGYVIWDDLGPLYPGETKTVTVTFQIVEPSTDGSENIDTASVTNAYFSNGRRTNDDDDDAEVRRASITGVVWSDVAPQGWQDPIVGYIGSDTFVPNVLVELYGCFNIKTNQLISPSDPDLASNRTCGEQDIGGENNVGEWRLVATDTTDQNGDYLFAGLDQGFYYVEVDNTTFPHGTATQTADPSPNGGGMNCGTCDHRWSNPTRDLNTTNFNPIDTDVEDIQNVNFGYTVPATIYGNLWNDIDGDGVWDATEPPLSGVTVELFDGVCTVGIDCPTTTTDSNGYYRFTNLSAGTYQVHVRESSLPSGGVWTQTYDPDDASPPCSGAECDGRTNDITAVANTMYGPKDFGYQQSGTASLGDTVYRDWDGNGTQDSGEEGISGVVMYLYLDNDADGVIDLTDTLLMTTTTDLNGNYSFDNLPDGDYIIQVSTPPSSTVQTQDPDGTADHTARRIVISGGVATINGASCTGGCNDDVDFGYLPFGFGSIGDFVWKDTNGNGSYDTGETGLNGVTVRLYEDINNNGVLDINDALVMTTTTNASGVYAFSNLAAGNYFVDVESTIVDSGETLSLNTNAPLYVALSLGEDYLDADFGYVPGGNIGDLVWLDNDGDGLLDAGEPGIQGVTVWLCNYDATPCNAGNALSTTTTDASGIYSFTNLASYTYTVAINTATLPVGVSQTYDPDEPNGAIPCVSCDDMSTLFLYPGQSNYGQDFGYQPFNAIGDFVWLDANQDGVQDGGENGISGVRLWLCSGTPDPCDASNATFTTTTDTDGYYSFGGMVAGTYTVEVDTSTLPLGVTTRTYDKDGGGDDRASGAVSGLDLTFDFGYYYGGGNTITGTTFIDVGDDGGLYVLGTDIPLSNVPVYLYRDVDGDGEVDAGTDTLVATTTSNTAGLYTFSNLPAGLNFLIVVDTSSPLINGLTLTYEPDEASVGDGDGKCETGEGCNNRTTTMAPASLKDFGFYAYMDCGDLPDSYNYRTALSREGPCHISNAVDPFDIPDHYLGAASDWDNEPDGQQNVSANGDDLAGIDDEDGVVAINFSTWTEDSTQSIQVIVVGDNAYLAGWFDWNSDGNFVTASGGYDTGEYVYFGYLAPGVHSLNVYIPDNVPPGCTNPNPCWSDANPLYLRFRLYEGGSPPPVIAPTGIVTNGEVEDYRWPDAPTAVTLTTFRVTPSINQVLISWETLLEIDTLGFNILRSTSPQGPRTQVNSVMIRSQALGGIPGEYSYEFADNNVEAGVTYYYWLEVVDVGGLFAYGPLQASPFFGLYFPFVNR